MSKSSDTRSPVFSELELVLRDSEERFGALVEKRVQTLQVGLLEKLVPELEKFKALSDQLAELVLDLTLSDLLITPTRLAELEQQASEIWVLTTDFINDTSAGPIRDGVEKNLTRDDCRYTYFLPNERSTFGPEVVARRREHAAHFEDYSERITYIEMPENTLFLFSEVAIHNAPPLMGAATLEINARGYTYARRPGDRSRELFFKLEDASVSAMIRGLQEVAGRVLLPSIAGQVLREYGAMLDDAALACLGRWYSGLRPVLAKAELDEFKASLDATVGLKGFQAKEIAGRFQPLLRSEPKGAST